MIRVQVRVEGVEDHQQFGGRAAAANHPFAVRERLSDSAIADSKLCKGYGSGPHGVVWVGIGGMKTYDTQFNNYIQGGPGNDPFIPMLIPDIACGLISIKHGLRARLHHRLRLCHRVARDRRWCR